VLLLDEASGGPGADATDRTGGQGGTQGPEPKATP